MSLCMSRDSALGAAPKPWAGMVELREVGNLWGHSPAQRLPQGHGDPQCCRRLQPTGFIPVHSLGLFRTSQCEAAFNKAKLGVISPLFLHRITWTIPVCVAQQHLGCALVRDSGTRSLPSHHSPLAPSLLLPLEPCTLLPWTLSPLCCLPSPTPRSHRVPEAGRAL